MPPFLCFYEDRFTDIVTVRDAGMEPGNGGWKSDSSFGGEPSGPIQKHSATGRISVVVSIRQAQIIMDGMAWKLIAFELLFGSGADFEMVIGRSHLGLRICMKQLAHLLHSDKPFYIGGLRRRKALYMFPKVTPIRCVLYFAFMSPRLRVDRMVNPRCLLI